MFSAGKPFISVAMMTMMMLLSRSTTRAFQASPKPGRRPRLISFSPSSSALFSTTEKAAGEDSAAATESKMENEPKVKPLPVNYAMDEIVSLCKRRGLIFPSSEIYNGYAGFYDYGPVGCELKRQVKEAWWRNFVTSREDVCGLDSSIIHNPATWKSSGTLSL